MPIEELRDHPKMQNAPSAARGMLWELCAHFWISECAEFSRDEDTLRWIMKAHRPTFRIWKPVILAVFDEIRPRFEHELNKYDRSLANLARLRERSKAATKARLRGAEQTLTSAAPVAPKRKAVNSAQRVEERTAAQEAGGGFVDAA